MKHFIIIFLVSFMGYSQNVSKQIIGTDGKTQTNSNYRISWTTIAPVVGLMKAGGHQLGNGYYPALDLQSLSIEDDLIDLQIKVYPNLTFQFLYVSHLKLNSFFIHVLDLNGKLIYLKLQKYSTKSFKQNLTPKTSYSLTKLRKIWCLMKS